MKIEYAKDYLHELYEEGRCKNRKYDFQPQVVLKRHTDMDKTKRLPTHPGDVLKEELEARGITQAKFASCLGVSYTMLNEILNGKRPITSDFAILVEAALGINPELLINMQSRYNMVQARLKPSIAVRISEIHNRAASWLL